MLTQQDRTLADCRTIFDQVAALGLRHVGYKDVGVSPATLRGLQSDLKAAGCLTYLEVVSEDADAELRSVRMALELGVDCLLGGTQAASVLPLLKGSGVAYFPFPGFPSGLPTKLGGTPSTIAEHCRTFMAKGAAGVDLLAYRASQAKPLDLVRAARSALGKAGRLICAGGVDSHQRITALAAAGCDAFTVGSAAFAGAFAADKTSLTDQLRAILQASQGAADAP